MLISFKISPWVRMRVVVFTSAPVSRDIVQCDALHRLANWVPRSPYSWSMFVQNKQTLTRYAVSISWQKEEDCQILTPHFSSESVWYLTREQTPEQTVVDQGYQWVHHNQIKFRLVHKLFFRKMTTLGLPVNALKKTSQTGCEGMPSL